MVTLINDTRAMNLKELVDRYNPSASQMVEFHNTGKTTINGILYIEQIKS